MSTAAEIVDAADTFAALGGVVICAPSAQRRTLISALEPLIRQGDLGPALILDPAATSERRRVRLVQALDEVLGLA